MDFSSRVAAHFRCRWSRDEEAAMRAAATRNAKRPGEAFQPDSRRKQVEAAPPAKLRHANAIVTGLAL